MLKRERRVVEAVVEHLSMDRCNFDRPGDERIPDRSIGGKLQHLTATEYVRRRTRAWRQTWLLEPLLDMLKRDTGSTFRDRRRRVPEHLDHPNCDSAGILYDVPTPPRQSSPAARHRGPYPHGPSCPGCLKERRCNRCSGVVDRSTRCVNGRCPTCCSVACRHPASP